MDFYSWNIVLTTSFGILATLIVIGNTLTIWIFFKQRRRKRAYYLLISLAVADLLVGVITVPLYITTMVTNHWLVIYTGTDVLTGIASIYTIAAISLERMYAIGWPLRHRTASFRFHVCAITIPWIAAGILTFLVVARFFFITEQQIYRYLLTFYLGTPLLVICVANFVIWRKQKSPLENNNHINIEVKLAKTLLLITGASLFTWLPFQIVNFLFELDVHLVISLNVWFMTRFIIKFLQFSNSLVNAIIYAFRIPEFKNALLKTFRCC